MCGIVGYIGPRQATDITVEGLKKLEYRGYDSAGIALLGDKISIYKKKGRVSELEKEIAKSKDKPTQTVAISHTRWATHGVPSDINAHPHSDEELTFAVVHNGIIENYKELREELKSEGYKFVSETDTEVLSYLFKQTYKENPDLEFIQLIKKALSKVVGTFGLGIISTHFPDQLIAARRGSPVVVGIGDDEYFVASDPLPIVEHTRRLIYLDDGDIISLTKEAFAIINLDFAKVERKIQQASHDIESVTKEGYKHFMLKEIFEQPQAFKNSTRGRLRSDVGEIKLGGLIDYEGYLANVNDITMLACGTSYYAGMFGAYLLERFAKVKATVEVASEFRYRDPVIEGGSVYIGLSQSGETADTLEALRLAKKSNSVNLGITNVVGSTLSRETDAGVYMHIGPEVGVAASKSFLSQMVILTMIALKTGQIRDILEKDEIAKLVTEMSEIGDKIKSSLELSDNIRAIAEKYVDTTGFFFLGRGYNLPIALESALKLKELSYCHAEGYPSGEMKHGPIALIDDKFTCVVVCPDDEYFEKNVGSIQEIKARSGKVIAVTTEGNEKLNDMADDIIYVPQTDPIFQPLVNIIPMQLFAYHYSDILGREIDMPRNLAKSVTVE